MQGRKTQRLLLESRLLLEASVSAVPPYFRNSSFHVTLIPTLSFPLTQDKRQRLTVILMF